MFLSVLQWYRFCNGFVWLAICIWHLRELSLQSWSSITSCHHKHHVRKCVCAAAAQPAAKPAAAAAEPSASKPATEPSRSKPAAVEPSAQPA